MAVCIKDKIKNLNLVIGCNIGCSYCYAKNNAIRYRITEDFAKPEFFINKLKLIEVKRPKNYFLTGMSDFSVWEDDWKEKVFSKIGENPQHQFIFLTKRPDLINFKTDLDNVWFGVTVTKHSELWRIDALRKNIKAKHYHVTFEPLFDDPGRVDFSGIEWIVIGTMTGARRKKVRTDIKWVYSIVEQAHVFNIPVFMKEDLVEIVGEENMIQELPILFEDVLEEPGVWKR